MRVQPADDELRLRIAKLSGACVPFGRLAEIGLDAFAAGIKLGQRDAREPVVSLCGAPVIGFRLIEILHQSAAPFLVEHTDLVHGGWIALLRGLEEQLRGLSLIDRPSLARQMH